MENKLDLFIQLNNIDNKSEGRKDSQMGSSQSKQTNNQAFRQQDWQQIEWQPYTNIKDPTFSSNFQVYAHKSNPNLELEKYQLFFNSQAEYISYLQIYYERKKYPNLVNSIHIEQTSKKNMCSTFHSACVYLERIHFRLSQLMEIPVEEGLYMIQAALEGYHQMFAKTGYFQAAADMIGVTKQGKVKVWVNKNFSKNFPDFNKIDQNKSQSNFVLELLTVIEQTLDYPKNKQTLKQYLLSKKIVPTFSTTKQVLIEYMKLYKYISHKAMKSIVMWVKKNSNKIIQSTSQFSNQLKTSTFSVASEKNGQHTGKQPQLQKIYNKKIEFSKLKNRMSNPRPAQINNNKYFVPYQNDFIIRDANQMSVQADREELETKRTIAAVNGPVRMSFIKNQRREPHFEQRVMIESPLLRNPVKVAQKLPSISFSYKSTGLYSPQNLQHKQNEWFPSPNPNKKPKKFHESTTEMEKKKQLRKSLTADISQDAIEGEKMRFYYSNGDTQEIDPDIARDLFTMSSIDQ